MWLLWHTGDDLCDASDILYLSECSGIWSSVWHLSHSLSMWLLWHLIFVMSLTSYIYVTVLTLMVPRTPYSCVTVRTSDDLCDASDIPYLCVWLFWLWWCLWHPIAVWLLWRLMICVMPLTSYIYVPALTLMVSDILNLCDCSDIWWSVWCFWHPTSMQLFWLWWCLWHPISMWLFWLWWCLWHPISMWLFWLWWCLTSYICVIALTSNDLSDASDIQYMCDCSDWWCLWHPMYVWLLWCLMICVMPLTSYIWLFPGVSEILYLWLPWRLMICVMPLTSYIYATVLTLMVSLTSYISVTALTSDDASDILYLWDCSDCDGVSDTLYLHDCPDIWWSAWCLWHPISMWLLWRLMICVMPLTSYMWLFWCILISYIYVNALTSDDLCDASDILYVTVLTVMVSLTSYIYVTVLDCNGVSDILYLCDCSDIWWYVWCLWHPISIIKQRCIFNIQFIQRNK